MLKNRITFIINIIMWLICLAGMIYLIVLIYNLPDGPNISKVVSIGVTITLTLELPLNIYIIIKVSKVESENSNILIKNNDEVNIKKADKVEIKNVIPKGKFKHDEVIIQIVMEYMNEFEYQILNGGFNINESFNLDLLQKPEQLRRKLGTEEYHCVDKKLNVYLLNMKEKLAVIGNNLALHSFSTITPNYNKMRWIEIQEDLQYGKKYANKYLATEKEYFDNTNQAILDLIAIYKEMINYWLNKNKR